MKLNISAIHKIINSSIEGGVSYNTIKSYIASDKRLRKAQDNYSEGSLIR